MLVEAKIPELPVGSKWMSMAFVVDFGLEVAPLSYAPCGMMLVVEKEHVPTALMHRPLITTSIAPSCASFACKLRRTGGWLVGWRSRSIAVLRCESCGLRGGFSERGATRGEVLM